MKVRYAMNISLTPALEKLVGQKVKSGLYQTASEVIRAGLRRLKEDQEARLPRTPETLKELEAELLKSVERLDRGEIAASATRDHTLRGEIADVGQHWHRVGIQPHADVARAGGMTEIRRIAA